MEQEGLSLEVKREDGLGRKTAARLSQTQSSTTPHSKAPAIPRFHSL